MDDFRAWSVLPCFSILAVVVYRCCPLISQRTRILAHAILKMISAICTAYGPPEVLVCQEVPKPNPKPKEVLIKIHATAVNSGDARIRRADPWIVKLIFGFHKPSFVLGGSYSGEIVAVGESVTHFSVGDVVYGSAVPTFGCYSQFICLPETGLIVKKPAHLSHEEAATIPFGWLTAMHFVKAGKIKEGQSVLIVGASGAVGTAAVQLCNHLGAKVTGVCGSSNVELVKSLGAEDVWDYSSGSSLPTGKVYDVVIETVGKTSFADCKRCVADQGKYIIVSGGLSDVLSGIITGLTSKVTVVQGICAETLENLRHITELFEKHGMKTIIDRTFPLSDIVEAHRHVDTGHKKGNVAITMT